jgi:hypothetical protein
MREGADAPTSSPGKGVSASGMNISTPRHQHLLPWGIQYPRHNNEKLIGRSGDLSCF